MQCNDWFNLGNELHTFHSRGMTQVKTIHKGNEK